MKLVWLHCWYNFYLGKMDLNAVYRLKISVELSELWALKLRNNKGKFPYEDLYGFTVTTICTLEGMDLNAVYRLKISVKMSKLWALKLRDNKEKKFPRKSLNGFIVIVVPG